MADVQYVTLYLPDGTTVSVIAGSQLYASYLATGATTTPPKRRPVTAPPAPVIPSVRSPLVVTWYATPYGPQSIIDAHTSAEYRRRGYQTVTAGQAAAYFASGGQVQW